MRFQLESPPFALTLRLCTCHFFHLEQSSTPLAFWMTRTHTLYVPPGSTCPTGYCLFISYVYVSVSSMRLETASISLYNSIWPINIIE